MITLPVWAFVLCIILTLQVGTTFGALMMALCQAAGDPLGGS